MIPGHRQLPREWKRARGFTLLEIAIVIAIIGIISGLILGGVTPVLNSSRASATNGKIQRIEGALLTYVMQNGCLPCPAEGDLTTNDANAGWSHSTAAYYGPNGPNNQPCAGTGIACNANGGGSATNATGIVPWRNLGLAENDITDPWGDRISYAVTSSLCSTIGSSMVRSLPADYPVGTLTVVNNAAVNQTTAAAYVLISYGPDRAYAFISGTGGTYQSPFGYVAGDPEFINGPTTGNGTTFRQDNSLFAPGDSYFDDIVLFRTAPDIISDCGINACGNPAD